MIVVRRRCLEGHPLQVSHKQDWGREFITIPGCCRLLPGSEAGSDGFEPVSGVSSEIVKPRARCIARCRGTLLRRGLGLFQWRPT